MLDGLGPSGYNLHSLFRVQDTFNGEGHLAFPTIEECIMNTLARMALVLGTVGWCLLSPAKAQAQINSISIDVSSSTRTTITGRGGYKVDTAGGWSVMSISLTVIPSAGGAESTAGATYAGGTWNNTTVTGLTPNTSYDVRAKMVIAKGGTTFMTIQSPLKVLTTSP